MAFYNDTQSRYAGPFARALDGAATWLHDAASTLAHRRAVRATFNELNTLTDRELADIGLSRSQLRSAAYSAVSEPR